MRLLLPFSALLTLASVPGCAGEPLCSDPIDRSGRGIPLCSSFDEAAVCDAPGAMARYERDLAGRLVLIDGELATCNASNVPSCPDPMEAPHCVVQPPS